jgi:hypothetical protein
LRIAAMVSTIGDTCRHGPHHGAQKSTITGSSLRSTSASHCAVVTDGTSSTGASELLVGPLARVDLRQPRVAPQALERHLVLHRILA